ncbi:hypothetical protein B0T09DRAFT_361342 [Sordaria sp. MPI-SDFR-AT-0083]|nr:hypothetical protein B0T09DRAFT_361342 [Sordaria sp. MPI-SDFR-AT-0083]
MAAAAAAAGGSQVGAPVDWVVPAPFDQLLQQQKEQEQQQQQQQQFPPAPAPALTPPPTLLALPPPPVLLAPDPAPPPALAPDPPPPLAPQEAPAPAKRGPGRPKGRLNNSTLARNAARDAELAAQLAEIAAAAEGHVAVNPGGGGILFHGHGVIDLDAGGVLQEAQALALAPELEPEPMEIEWEITPQAHEVLVQRYIKWKASLDVGGQ